MVCLSPARLCLSASFSPRTSYQFLSVASLLVVLSLSFSEYRLLAADWPQFRGPSGEGLSSETMLPIEWSEEKNIRWKTEIPGRGWSSPALRDGKIWLTTAVDDGKQLRAICVDAAQGQILHDVLVFELDDPGAIHSKNSHASPTPWIEENRIYVHFGAHGTACLDPSGKILWKTKLEYDHRHGPAASPVVVDQLLIISCDGDDKQFVVALDKLTGQEVWRTSREGAMAYCTPLLIQVPQPDGTKQAQVVCPGGEWVIAYNPKSGEEIWKVRYPKGYSNVPRPVYAHGLVVVSSGYNTPVVFAIDPTGQGDITETHVRWQMKKGAPLNPSPVVVGDEIYFISDGGIASCVDMKTGKVHWQQRIPGNYSASWVFAAGKLYITNEAGLTTVVRPGTEFEVLAENPLPGRTLATLAPVDQSIFLRTDHHLYRIEAPKP
ncbi:PQQ-binding-like beta-propeller repeat protein [Planctopirus hydrillae]|uniref:PQQ-binding-like beta-propeller repeat protein n=1 Tax=Planctopirus hydrillae TaxID=1841610 RepID=UPI0009F57091|nr:PQQ-binding-like beta-propeller repeat protein [Planctopirus hydrillae]